MATPDIVGQFLRGRQARQQNQLFEQQLAGNQQKQEQAQQTKQLSGQILSGDQVDANLKKLFAQDPAAAEGVLNSLGLVDKRKRDQASSFAFDLVNTAPGSRAGKINARAASLQSQGRDPSDTLNLLGMPVEQQDNALRTIQQAALSNKERISQQRGEKKIVSSSLAEFEALTSDLSPEKKQEATLIKLGLSPRAVGSSIQTISDRGIQDQVGNASATIKQREKFGELTGSSRAKTIDSGFERIQKIDVGIGNIDRAVAALNSGAGVGSIEKFLPSFKAASVELDNIQGSMALDVIGAVTFGALSEGELNLAKQVALPTGLDTPELIKYLGDRKIAQEKLRSYFNEQIQFLDQGGTVAGFLRSKERGSEGQQGGLSAGEQAELAALEAEFGGQ